MAPLLKNPYEGYKKVASSAFVWQMPFFACWGVTPQTPLHLENSERRIRLFYIFYVTLIWQKQIKKQPGKIPDCFDGGAYKMFEYL